MLSRSQRLAAPGSDRPAPKASSGAAPGPQAPSTRPAEWTVRAPVAADGPAVHALIAACPPLDPNSLYCNLLQCTHFAGTCSLAERDGRIYGWVSAYVPPDAPDTLFVWQVAVDPGARGEGLARRLIRAVLARPAASGVHRLATSITPGNEGSWALFRSLAHDLDAPFSETPWFLADVHFGGRHATEHLVNIGPFSSL